MWDERHNLIEELGSFNWKRLIDAAFGFWQKHARSCFIPVFIMLLIGYVPMRIFQYRHTNLFLGFSAESGSEKMTEMLINMVGYMGALLFNMFILGMSYFLVCHLVMNRLHRRTVSTGTLLRDTFRARNVGTFLLFSLLVGIGFMLCVLPGLFLLLMFGLFVPVMIREGKSGMEALTRSWKLLIYNPERKFGASPAFRLGVTLVVAWAVSVALQYLVAIPMLIYHFAVTLRSASAQNPALFMTSFEYQAVSVLMEVLMLGIRSLYMILVLTILVFFYYQARDIREGYDLESMLRRSAG